MEQAEINKQQAAKLHADIISQEIAKIEEEVHVLVQTKVDNGFIKKPAHPSVSVEIGDRGFTITEGDDVIYYNHRKKKRTYSNLVLAYGLNNLVLDGDLNSIQDSDFQFGRSRFFELGINYKTRILKTGSVPYINYGLSLRYNNLRPKSDQFFVTNGNDTYLETHEHNLKKTNFRNVQLVVPVFLEFDFSKPKTEKEKTIYRRNRGFRLGFGGFGGVNLKSKQVLKYKLDGKRIKEKMKGDFNVNKFVYGLNALIGYKDTSFYVKYDLQDLFKDSFKDQKNLSFGVRFDL